MTLYTFGYEGLAIDDFISRLDEMKIKTIVDVRELPLSRKRGFSKKSFADSLAHADIAYMHMPALGCPKEVRNEYKIDQNWAKYTSSFHAYLKTQDASLRELAKISRTASACLVCFEADFNMCHRTYVARAAAKFGAPSILHITAQKVIADSLLPVAA
jgi:uncharacterized protein (DUF488 family)